MDQRHVSCKPERNCEDNRQNTIPGTSGGDVAWMRRALREAELAAGAGEVPVGAVLVSSEGELLAEAHNRRERSQDPTSHAEMLVIRQGSKRVGSWRLLGATLYVTLEPCAMCAGALVLARVDRLVFATRDPKAGAVGSVMDVVAHPALNHRVHVTSGVLEDDASRLLSGFFQRLRARHRGDRDSGESSDSSDSGEQR